MNSTAILTSPFQIIALKEYLFAQDIDNCQTLVLCQPNERIRKQIEASAAMLDVSIDAIFFLDGKFQSHYLKLNKILPEITDELILGHLFSEPLLNATNKVKYQSLTVLDDGLSSLKIPKVFHDKEFVKSSKSRLNKLVKRFLSIKTTFPEKIDLFTILNVEKASGINIKRNELNYLKGHMQTHPISNICYLIGQPFVENGELEENFYLDLVTQFIERSKNQYEEFVYVSHRIESERKLLLISERFNQMEIKKFDLSLELEIVRTDTIPAQFVGFCSTALITLNSLFQGREVRFGTIPISKNSYLKHGERLDGMAKYIRKCGIEPVRFDS